MRKFLLILLLAFITNILLTACSSSKTDASAQAVETYLNTLVAKDADRLPTLVCGDWEEQAKRPFVQIKDHVLLPQASELEQVDAVMKQLITPEKIHAVVALIPDNWLINEGDTENQEEKRKVYSNFLINRLNQSAVFVNEARHARESLI